MKRAVLISAVILLLASVCQAQGISLGLGAFAGINIPVVQDDQGGGSVFGFKARINTPVFFVLEPNFTYSKWGEPDAVDGVDLGVDGSKITSFGIDATLGGVGGGKGLKPFAVVGAAIYKITNDDTDYDESKLGVSAGVGVLLGIMPNFDIDVRGKMFVAPQEEGSKKGIMATAGVNYYFGVGM